MQDQLIATGTTVAFDSGDDIIHRIEGRELIRAKAEGIGTITNSFGQPGWGAVRYEVATPHGDYLIDARHVLEAGEVAA